MSNPTFASPVTITHLGTATAILRVGDITFITDPYLSPEGTEWPVPGGVLKNSYTPPLGLSELPPIDAVLLSHEDHPDNLDQLGRQLLDGRRVLTTVDGASKLAPRPGVKGLKPWEVTTLNIGGKSFEVMGTPCQHLPGGEVTGFVITAPDFGSTGGLPNAIFFSGDTVYLEELGQIRERFHISIAMLNAGAARFLLPGASEPTLITMDGQQAARLFRDLEADVLVPMHFEAWTHFGENREQLALVFQEEGIADKVQWLELGIPKKLF